MPSAAFIVTVSCLTLGCGRIAFDPRDVTPDGAARPMFWGEYAATLDIPPCGAGPELVVNDTTDSLDGGMTVADPANAGPTLSLIEAMWIANNRAGYDVIHFDSDVFPVDAPATITITPAALLPFNVMEACIDGRNRGVIVDWLQGPTTACPPAVVTGSLLVGLTYINTNYELVVANSQVAGMRIGTDGITTLQRVRPWAIEASGASTVTIGPGNVIASSQYAVRVFGGMSRIFDNYIGYDVLTGAVFGTTHGFDLRPGGSDLLQINHNVIAVSAKVLDAGMALSYPTLFANNDVGTHDGMPIAGTFAGLNLQNSSWIIEDNVFANVGTAITLAPTVMAVLVRNLVTNATAAIEYPSGAPIGAPTIDVATATTISGGCAGQYVEVFADPGNLAAQYLGAASCTGGAYSLAGSFPVGLNALATQTGTMATSALSAPVPIQ